MNFHLSIVFILIGFAFDLKSQTRKQIMEQLDGIYYKLDQIIDASNLEKKNLLKELNEVKRENQRLESKLNHLNYEIDSLTLKLNHITELLSGSSIYNPIHGINSNNQTQTKPKVNPSKERQGPNNHFGRGINGNGDDFGQGRGSGTGIGDGDGDDENFIDKGIGGSGSRIRYPASLSKFSGLPANSVTISFKLTVRPDGTVRRAEEVLSTASHTIKPSILSEVKAEILRKIKYKPASQETINWFTLVIYSK